MRAILAIFLFPVLLLTASCAPSEPVTTAQPRPVEENVINVALTADSQVNLYSGTSHALHICFYQMSDPNAFYQLSESEMGISKLMNCERLDMGPAVPGVVYSIKQVMQPGEKKSFRMDRAEGAKYVGVVAGYYRLQKRTVTRFYTIPMIETMKSRPLNIDLYLGPQGIRE